MMLRTIRLGGMILAVSALLAACSSGPVVREGEPTITHTATMKTSMGDIVIDLYGQDAPKTVANFVGLAERGFYNDILFHRVARGFVIQAGDPKTKDPSLESQWGTGGESIYGGTFEDELNPATISYKRGYVEGTVAMANRGPNTNTSQFFIMLGETSLPKNYTIFGKVSQGLDVVHAIENTPLKNESQMGGMPATPVKIVGISVKKY